MALLAGTGVLLSGYLVATRALHAPAYCPAGSGCDIVQSSRYGVLFGIPVSVLGLLFYGFLLALALRRLTHVARFALLLPTASAGVAASAVFVGIQQLVVRATCTLCLLSAFLALGILTLALVRRPRPASAGSWLWSGGAALAVVALLAVGYGRSAPGPAVSGYAEGLARHLAASGARFYGAYWCPHCQDQKAIFGRAARALPYIECDPRGVAAQPQACISAGIRAYPTWDIGGKRYEGFLSLDELARLSGYPPPGGGQ
ncbi:MAG: vitamin K epoxide reductase family protein [Armatimonadota bacterium]|nr:vitamin K epoxide reductase family protein [Armatimonadota bacterium]